MIGSVMGAMIEIRYDIDIIEMRPCLDLSKFPEYDLVILGFPTYYFRPPLSAMEFVKELPDLKGKCFYIFTTYGLYSGNSIRILSDALREKNGRIIGYTQIRGPASDGVLLFPSVRLFCRYERYSDRKISKALSRISQFLLQGREKEDMPRRRWYSPFTRIFKRQLDSIEYSQYRLNLRVIKERCTNCNICVKNCIRSCWARGDEHPSINTSNCEFCLKCVHNCPERAIIFNDKMMDRLRLDSKFYQKQKEILLNKI